jgi:gamma-glutamyl-gamma-aminobutyrate hydrolase PuuD
LVATGFSIGDDIIEIVELKNYPNFFLGVQWHPEFLVTKYDEDIFKTFCKSVTN